MKIHEFIWPDDRIDHIARHGVQPEEVEEVCFGQALVQRARSSGSMRQKLPATDSMEELARFWDTHDLTDFEEDLEEVWGPVFVGGKGMTLSIHLRPAEAERLKRIARAKRLKETSVVRTVDSGETPGWPHWPTAGRVAAAGDTEVAPRLNTAPSRNGGRFRFDPQSRTTLRSTIAIVDSAAGDLPWRYFDVGLDSGLRSQH